MHAAPTRPDDACDPERIARRSRALQDLAEAGLELARALVDEVAAGREGRFRGVDPALAYSRIARAVRLTIALEARLGETPAEAARSAPSAADADEPGPVAEIETAERSEPREFERPERERLREGLADAVLLSRPSAELYALICRDLGATPEPGLFPEEACNDDAPKGAADASAPEPPQEPPRRARRLSAGSGRAAMLRTAAAAPLAGSPLTLPMAAEAPVRGPFRPPP